MQTRPSEIYARIFERLDAAGMNKLDYARPQHLNFVQGFAENNPWREMYHGEITLSRHVFSVLREGLMELTGYVERHAGLNFAIDFVEPRGATPLTQGDCRKKEKAFQRVVQSAHLISSLPVYFVSPWRAVHVFGPIELDLSSNFAILLFLLKDELLADRAILLPSSIYGENGIIGGELYSLGTSEIANLYGARSVRQRLQMDRPSDVVQDFKKLLCVAFPSIEGLSFEDTKKVLKDHQGSLGRYQHFLKRELEKSQDDPKALESKISDELDYEFNKLEESYAEVVRKLRWGGVDCALGLVALALTFVLPDQHSRIISALFGSAKISDGIKYIAGHIKARKSLRTTSDCWLPWYMSKLRS